MIKPKYTPHILALGALFTLGNVIIVLPFFSLVNLILYCVLSLILAFTISFLLSFGQKNRVVFLCVAATVCIAAIYGVITAFLDYIIFLKKEQMPQSNVLLLGIVFFIIVLFFSISRVTSIYKYSLFVFVIAVTVIMVCFMGGIKNFDYKNINSNFFELSFSLRQFLRFFSPLIALPFLVKCDNKSTKPLCFGIFAGFLLVIITALQIIFTLGAGSHALSYPYLKSVSVISSGSLFTRLDGMIYFLFFVTSLIKITVCINAIKQCLAKR